MPTMIAIHEIHRGREVIAPKQKFTATDKDAEALLASGAAEVTAGEEPAEDGTKAPAEKNAKAKAKAKPESDADDNLTE